MLICAAVIPDEGIDALGPMRRYTVRVEVETRGGRTGQGTAAGRIVELVAELEGLADTAQLTELLRRPS